MLAEQSWSRADQSSEAPHGVDYGAGSVDLLERAAIAAFQRSAQWTTTDVLGAFKPVSSPLSASDERATSRNVPVLIDSRIHS